MPQPSSHASSPRALSTGNRSGFSKKQWREVRKELLVARSTLARLEVMQAREAFSDSMSRFGWLGMIVPGFRKRAHAGASESLLASLATSLPGFLQPVLRSAWPFLQRHPVSAALLAIITGRSDTSRGALGVAGPAKWMGIAVVGIKALGAWRKLNRYRHARRTRKAERT